MLLSGGYGGARMADGLAAVLPPECLTVVVNVGDDDHLHGVVVCPDLDTVLYRLSGLAGDRTWGIEGDSYTEMELLNKHSDDRWFTMGDQDIANSRRRREALEAGVPLSKFTAEFAASLGVEVAVLPASDDRVRTRVRTADGWHAFQEYFVRLGHQPEVLELDFAGAGEAAPAPGVLEAIAAADLVVIAPSNPPLSIWPILAIPGIRPAIAAAPEVVAVSPLVGGRAVKGPADRVMSSLGLPPGSAGVAAAYAGLIDTLVIDTEDEADAATLDGVDVWVTSTRIGTRRHGAYFATELLARL